jgi:Uma2 family endonuclease
MVARQKPLTAEEYLKLPDDPGTRHELVRGELVEVGFATAVPGWIVGLIFELLTEFVRRENLGVVFGDGVGYIVTRNPDSVRGPDVSFVSAKRVAEVGIPNGNWPFAPDLAVEVFSPGDRRKRLQAKIRDYLGGGSRLVWVVWPTTRSLTAYSVDGLVRTFGPNDELEGGDVLPGFRVRVADLFPPGI